MKGYKAFNKDLKCRNFQYEVGNIYELDGKPVICKYGFHFCLSIADCYRFYPMMGDTRICEIEAFGEIVTDIDSIKYCTNKIKIIREIKNDSEKRANTGTNNIGFCNIGSWNVGNRNVGNYNTGNSNTGDHNSGRWNTGDHNSGSWNTGNRNTKNSNTGSYNVGIQNTGNYNSGDWNTGNCNAGLLNTGDYNIGYRNTGAYNTGNCNAGNCNVGDCNTGDWNITNFETGCFNTQERKIRLFNQESNLLYSEWLESDARQLLNTIPKRVIEWVQDIHMTEEEKEENPSYKTTGGYLKIINGVEVAQLWWDNLNETEKETIKSIPNFNPDIFEECTGIKVNT